MPKPHKVEEPAGTYSVSAKQAEKSASPAGNPASSGSGVRYARSEDVRAANARLMRVHRKVLEKLAK
ncbi:MAG: hypothetical protein ABIZ49_14185 [Opitutaceae bacterium]